MHRERLLCENERGLNLGMYFDSWKIECVTSDLMKFERGNFIFKFSLRLKMVLPYEKYAKVRTFSKLKNRKQRTATPNAYKKAFSNTNIIDYTAKT